MVVQLRHITKYIAPDGWNFAPLSLKVVWGPPFFISFLGFIYILNRPLHGFRRHLGCGALAAKITVNVWDIIQLSTLITPQLSSDFEKNIYFF